MFSGCVIPCREYYCKENITTFFQWSTFQDPVFDCQQFPLYYWFRWNYEWFENYNFGCWTFGHSHVLCKNFHCQPPDLALQLFQCIEPLNYCRWMAFHVRYRWSGGAFDGFHMGSNREGFHNGKCMAGFARLYEFIHLPKLPSRSSRFLAWLCFLPLNLL